MHTIEDPSIATFTANCKVQRRRLEAVERNVEKEIFAVPCEFTWLRAVEVQANEFHGRLNDARLEAEKGHPGDFDTLRTDGLSSHTLTQRGPENDQEVVQQQAAARNAYLDESARADEVEERRFLRIADKPLQLHIPNHAHHL